MGEVGRTVQYGVSKSAKSEGLYKLLRITDIQENKVIWENVPFTDIEEEEAESFVLENGDFLFARTGATVGKSYLVENLMQKSVFASYLIRISLLPNNNINYIKYFFNSEYYWQQISEKSVGIGQPNVNGTSLKELFLPLPPLSEQQHIVSKVEELLALVEDLETNKTDLKSTIQQTKAKVLDMAIRGELVPQNPDDEPASVLLERIKNEQQSAKSKKKNTVHNTHYDNDKLLMVNDEFPFEIPENWTWCRLGEIFKIGSSKRVLQSDWKQEGIPFYRAREIVKLSENNIVNNDLFISEELYEQLKKTYGVPQEGDILISAVGTIGKPYVVKKEDLFYYKDASVLCFQNIHNTNSNYINSIMKSEFIQAQIYENSKGTTVDTITIEKAKGYILPLPPLAEQQRIVEKIEHIFSVLDELEENLG
ncbi:restriction endonuclease subunit S [Capnocytophaga canimorsus]|uniref:restriction endonuclease subunit S n=1 Tax=Capnocytophaga canimorsus TaxID=28188 RepID=UPI000BB1AB78|nr:restriction endonuclease subunit S [Capnocytophaga canimorsus]ATA76317.1 type I restriction endonuclease [Capnocytophaga canimorsus]